MLESCSIKNVAKKVLSKTNGLLNTKYIFLFYISTEEHFRK